MKGSIINIIFIVFCALILGLSLRGVYGNPSAETINDSFWVEDGPFELSPERGRFALTYSIIEDQSVSFSVPLARFILPDLGYQDGKYVSIFAPGVSFIVVPGYLIGKIFGTAQVGTYLIISLFAILNAALVRKIARFLGAKEFPSLLASAIFLFATPAFSYAVSLYQHHLSTFLILLCIYLTLRSSSLKTHFIIWFLYALAFLVDYPNAFIIAPVVIYLLSNTLKKRKLKGATKISFNYAKTLAITGVLLPLALLFWFNQVSYGSPVQLSGTVDDVAEITENGTPILSKYLIKPDSSDAPNEVMNKKSALAFFNTRNMINGLYVLLISPDRGIIFYAPIVIFGFLGISYLRKNHQKENALFICLIGINILLYSMWGDPWGGWAFGSRYLIPSYAVLSIMMSFILPRLRKNKVILSFFFIVLGYCLAVNSLGALTSSSNPPKIEAQSLGVEYNRVEKYTFERNWDLLLKDRSKSFIYKTIAKNYLSAGQYYYLIVSTLMFVLMFSYFAYLYLFDSYQKRTKFK